MSGGDLETLLNALLPFAKRMLREHGEFYPFGASMRHDGEISPVAGVPDGERPDSREVIESLLDGFQQLAEAGELKAVGICFDATVVPPGEEREVDAIQTNLEHVSGETLEVVVPYRKRRLRKIAFGEAVASTGASFVFDAQDR